MIMPLSIHRFPQATARYEPQEDVAHRTTGRQVRLLALQVRSLHPHLDGHAQNWYFLFLNDWKLR